MTSSNPSMVVDDRFRALVQDHGLAKAACLMGRRYATVRAAAREAGIPIRRGRRRLPVTEQRDQEIYKLRRDGHLFLVDIGNRYNIGRERVRQILERLGGDPLQTVLDEQEVDVREQKAVTMRKGGCSVAEIATVVDLTPVHIRKLLMKLPGGDPLGLLGYHVHRDGTQKAVRA
jgi:Sigma-70, region 4